MKYKVLMSLVIIALMLVPLSCDNGSIPPSNETWVTPSEDELLGQYENSDLLFRKTVGDKWIAYSLHRKIDDAIVELDRKVYIFNATTKELIEKDVHWRDDLPDELPSIISKEEAMSIGGGTTAFLIYIDPDSVGFSIEPTENPCWAVRIWKYMPELNGTYNVDVIVVDAVTGEILGHGTPIP